MVVATSSPLIPASDKLNPLGTDLLEKCFIHSPQERPSAQELLNHPWLQDVEEWKINPHLLNDQRDEGSSGQ